MSSILTRILLVILLLLAAFVAIGTVLPREYQIESRITIDAAPESVFLLVNNLTNWPTWSTWNEERVEDLNIAYGEKTEGVGAVQNWTDARGSGKLWITESESPKFVVYRMRFGDFPEFASRFEFSPVEAGTEVRWTSEGRLPSGPFYGYAALLFPRQMSHQYDLSLQRLKKISEGKPQ